MSCRVKLINFEVYHIFSFYSSQHQAQRFDGVPVLTHQHNSKRRQQLFQWLMFYDIGLSQK